MSANWNQEGVYGLICHWGQRKVQVPLKEIHTDVVVRGFTADVESSLIYYNGNNEPVETKFVFPMTDKSAVYKFEAHIEGRRIVAECMETNKAQTKYNKALSRGQTAMLMMEDRQSGDIFEIKLGNLPPYTEAKLTLAYVTELPVEPKGVVVFTLPAVLNPRYMPAGSSSAPTSVPDNAIVTHLSNIKKYAMTFSARVVGDYVIKSVTSPKDKFTVEQPDGATCAIVTLAEPFNFDHDLTLGIQYEEIYRPQIIMEKGSSESEGILKEDVLMLNFFPNFDRAPTIKGEYVFMIDRSGSMGGTRIRKASETLLLLIKSLPADSRFNIIGFGSTFKPLFDKSKKYDADSLRMAKIYQSKIDASMGGTEILQPLKFVYSKKVKPPYCRQIFLLTDGEVANTRDVIALVKSNAKSTRVFTFGMGSGASSSLIENVAAVSGGKPTFVKDSERLQAKVMSVMKCAMQPCVTDVTLQWQLPKGVEIINLPREPPAIFKGEKLVLYAIIKGKTKKLEDRISSLIIRGQIGSDKLYFKLEFDIKQQDICVNLPIHRLVAKAQIKDLEINDSKSIHSKSMYKDLIILLSTSANIVSKYTAFVGVDKSKRDKKTDLFWLLKKLHQTQNDASYNDDSCSDDSSSDDDSDDWEDDCKFGSDDADVVTMSNIHRAYRHIGYAPTPSISGSTSGTHVVMPPPPPPPNRTQYGGTSGPQSALLNAIRKGSSLKGCVDNSNVRAGTAPPPPPPPQYSVFPGESQYPAIAPPQPPPPAPGGRSSGLPHMSPSSAPPPPPPPPSSNVPGPLYRAVPPPPPPPPSNNVPGTFYQAVRPPPPPPQIGSIGSPHHIMDNAMMSLIDMQEFDGSWKYDDKMLHLLNRSAEEIKKSSKTENIDVWITALAVAWLRIYQGNKKDEWELLEQKAITWITSQITDHITAEQIIDSAIIYLQKTD